MTGRLRPLVVTLICSVLVACQYGRQPPCPQSGPGDVAPSAGCLLLVHGRVLVVEDWRGKVSPPGGTVEPGESAQCTAHRETWEESGLDLVPGALFHTFDTGFNLYHCAIGPDSGTISPHAMTEVRRAYWLPLAEFDAVRWRFPKQGAQLQALIQSSEPAPLSD